MTEEINKKDSKDVENKPKKPKKTNTREIVYSLILVGLIGFGIKKRTNNNEISLPMNKAETKIEVKNKKQNITAKTYKKGDNKNKIALLHIEGTIQGGTPTLFNNQTYDHQLVLDTIKAIKKDDTIKGVILVINSPGGAVYESQQVYKELLALKEERKIPVHAVFKSIAASGGYYIATASDHITASQETLTGSIGVIMGGKNYTDLFKKLGISSNIIKSGSHKDIGSNAREMTDEEKQILQTMINGAYERFVDVVEKGRKLPREEVKKLADGRIYDGQQALEKGLVDSIGFVDDAIDYMAKEIKVEKPMVIDISNVNSTGLFSAETKLDITKSIQKAIKEEIDNKTAIEYK